MMVCFRNDSAQDGVGIDDGCMVMGVRRESGGSYLVTTPHTHRRRASSLGAIHWAAESPNDAMRVVLQRLTRPRGRTRGSSLLLV